MDFKQWLSDQTPKTFAFVNSIDSPGKLTMQVGFGGQVIGELHNLTNVDLQSLHQVLNLRFPPANP